MRVHALILTLFVLGAHTASIPDKKDIEKKLAEVVKEVLSKDETPVENVSSEQELIEQTNGVKDVENNLRKSAQPVDIPVKVVVEDVKPALKTDDKKEDNEVSPSGEESFEIKREEIDVKNPGAPQHTQHETQSPPEHIPDAQQTIALKNSEWRASPQYNQLQKEITTIKDTFENKMTELIGSLQEHWKTHPVEKDENNIKVRAGVSAEKESKQDNTNSTSGPFGGFFQNWVTQFQQNINNLNQTVNEYWNNSTSNSSNSNQCSGGGGGGNFFNLGGNNPVNFGSQTGQGQQQQSDEQRPPSLLQTLQQNVQNFFQGPPAGAQSDTPQTGQPNRPVIQAFQNAIQSVGNVFSGARPPASPETPQQPSQTTTQEGANVIPTETKPQGESQKEKPEQVTLAPQQSGPIKQLIGNNAVVQGIAGAVQRIQHTIIPNRPRDEVKNVGDAQNTKAGWIPPPPPRPHVPGDNNDSNGVVIKNVPIEPTKEEIPTQEPAKEDVKAPVEPEKTE